MMNLSQLTDHILCIFKIILIISSRNTKNEPSIRIHVNKIENKNTFRIRTGYYFELLMPETMKVFVSTKSKITKNKNGENILRLEIIEVVFVVLLSIVLLATMIGDIIQESGIHLSPINPLVNF